MRMLIESIKRSFHEQLRSFWILIMALTVAPFFIVVYYLIGNGLSYQCKIAVVNYDTGCIISSGQAIFHSEKIIQTLSQNYDFLTIENVPDSAKAIEMVKRKDIHVAVFLMPDFSSKIEKYRTDSLQIPVLLKGDVTNYNYIMGAVWVYEGAKKYIYQYTHIKDPILFREEPVGMTANMNEFDLYVPGLLMFALVMLLFTASIAFIKDIENGTIRRLILANVPVSFYIGGISIVQLMVGFAAVAISLIIAVALGFNYGGSLFGIVVIVFLTSVSLISFSIILAAFTKSANQILVVGAFPMFLFMFFSGIMFPFPFDTLFTMGEYNFSISSLISTTPAVTAMQKLMFYNQTITDIWPELLIITTLSILYAILGGIAFKFRHLRRI